MLTTIDNPYNPHTNFDEWFAFDVSHGYNTCAYIARMADAFGASYDTITNETAIDKAMNWICLRDPTEMFVLVDKTGRKLSGEENID